MWLIGAIIGGVLGGLMGPQFWLLGALLGAAAGSVAGSRMKERAASSSPDLLQRLQRLEDEVASLRHAVGALQAGRGPSEIDVPTTRPPISPSAPAVEPRIEAPAAIGESLAEAPPSVAAAPAAEVPAGRPEPTPDAMPAWLRKLWEGNPLAKIGIVLLFFGVASGLRLAAEYGLMPVPLRLFLTAAAAIALIVFGVAKGREGEHRTFGLALQGGGFALLYLVGYFMLGRYAMIGPSLAFFLFALLGVICMVLAARQDGPALAVLGLSGAFLAPVLAGGHADSPLALFSYFALLNALILAVDWFKSWRVLNLAGFFFTLAVGMAWAVDGYQDRHYLITQIFVVIFLAAYSAMPVATALLRAPGMSGWGDATLIFGTPLVGAFLQARLMSGVEYGLAWSALIGSLWYFGLWALMIRRAEPEIRLVERTHLGLAIALLTVSVPLAFGAQVTSAFWAGEGAAVLWFGVSRRRTLAQGVGLAMQFAAGAALLLNWQSLSHRLPVLNDVVLGAALLTLAGLVSARLLRSLERDAEVPPLLPFVWALLWLLGTGLGEIERFAPFALHAPYGLLFVAVSVLALEGLSRLWAWPQVRASAALLLAAMWLAALVTVDRSGHPFAGFMVLVLPASAVLHYVLLAAHERAGTPALNALRHLGMWWLLLLAIPFELSWHAGEIAPAVHLWPFVAWGAVLAAGVALPSLGNRRFWPFSVVEAQYLPYGVAPPGLALVLLLAWANLNLGGESGLALLPYLPVISFFDATQLAGIGAILLLARHIGDRYRDALRLVAAASGFLWLSALAARIAHHWGGVPFEFGALMQSALFQALLTALWTTVAIATMIAASRRNRRDAWFGGFGLLGVVGAKLLLFDAAGRGTVTWTATLIGVALLVLAAGYFAPLPPKESVAERSANA